MKNIVLSGATGDLGRRISQQLLARGASVRALCRNRGGGAEELRQSGAEVVTVDYDDASSLARACEGANCVVSALSGLSDVIVTAQSRLLDAAILAGVPRFIPSDFSIDFTQLPAGNNRNLDLRREFQARLEGEPIRATSVLNGMFAELLLDQAPMVLFAWRRVLYFGDVHQPLDFTTKDDTAAYTAAAALDPSTPRFLRIVGDRLDARGLAEAASRATGKKFRTLWGGTVGMLDAMAKTARWLNPATPAIYPAWQGMQYMRDMFDGRGLLAPLDNDRYPPLTWTKVESLLAQRAERSQSRQN